MNMSELRDLISNIDRAESAIKDLTAVTLRGNRYDIDIVARGSGNTGISITDQDLVKLIHAAALRVVSERRDNLLDRLKETVPSISVKA